MPRNEHRQFQMALGNRQLLTLFFTVVVLLGVFFATGFMTGRNASTVLADSSPRAAEPLIVDSVAFRGSLAAKTDGQDSSSKEAAPQKAHEKRGAATEVSYRQETRPNTGDGEPARAATQATTKAVIPAARASEKLPNEGSVRTDSGKQVEPHKSYLQLAATSKSDADAMVDGLRNKGFSTVATEIREKPGTWRVFVGPVGEGGVDTLRADLQRLGFPGSAAIRRIF